MNDLQTKINEDNKTKQKLKEIQKEQSKKHHTLKLE